MAACVVAAAQQLPAPPPVPAWVAVKPIDPPGSPLPAEAASARYEYSRSWVRRHPERQRSGWRCRRGAPGAQPGDGLHARESQGTGLDAFPHTIRSPVWGCRPPRPDGHHVNVGFTPIIERLTRGANIPYFLSAGNHDVTTMPAGDPARALGLHNTLTAISRLIPPEGSPRRLNGYPTYAFGYGNAFVIALDSNIASDVVQLAWVTDQLDQLDRARYRHVIAFFHHPPFSSGPHGGASADPVPGTGRKAPDRIEAQTAAIRTMYMPLFRKHHVRLLVAGHDHLYDHWVERYDNAGVTHRMDTIVTGGGGAPIYGYMGELLISARTSRQARRTTSGSST